MAQEIKPSQATSATPQQLPEPLASVRTEFDRLFDSLLGGGRGFAPLAATSRWGMPIAPRIDLRESNDRYVVEAELPGLKEDDVTVTFANGILTLKGEKKHEHGETTDDYHLAERSYGRFQRSFRVGEGVDADGVRAAFDKGVLKVTLPKRTDGTHSERRIPIGGA